MKFLKFLGITAIAYIVMFIFLAMFCFVFWDWILIHNVFTFATEKGATAHRVFLLISALIGLGANDCDI